MKHIVSLSFSDDPKNSEQQFDRQINFFGETMRVSQFCTGLDIELTKNLIKKFDGNSDIICLSGLPPKVSYKGEEFVHPGVSDVKKLAKQTVVVDGQVLREIYLPWAIRQHELRNQSLFARKKVSFYSGGISKNLLEIFEEFDCKICLADPYFFLKLPFNLKSSQEFENFISIASPLLKRLPVKKGQLADFKLNEKKIKIGPFGVGRYQRNLEEFFESDIFVGDLSTLRSIDLDHLKGKTLIIDIADEQFLNELKNYGVEKVLVGLPEIHPDISCHFALLEGILAMKYDAEVPLRPSEVLNFVDELNLKPKVYNLNETPSGNRAFAFIVHPLTSAQFFRHPKLKWLRPFKKNLSSSFEDVMALGPGFYWGNIKGIKSEFNGVEVEGHIYMLAYTPKKLMESDPSSVYKKLVGLCTEAKLIGAKIVGLGAYTKIVGDAGVTVSKMSPIPVTTGNSLSAASTLWAAKLAVEKMGMVALKNGIYQGRVMVIGATGSIGAVSAKILSGLWKEVVIVAPRAHRLLELKSEILKINPKAKVLLSTDPSKYLPTCQLVITTTSAKGVKVLNMADVRPGAVICDVARPFDISEAEARQRPDVLIMASGEVELPGPTKINVDLALEGNVVYACLAETALLSMEGRFESFTLSRNINYQKVLEIDQLAKKHGVKLSQIMGHHGPLTEEEFELCRSHALKGDTPQPIH